ncbi:MAG: acyltransferase family protein [Firmicutes bacterium]|nr:acyltransferase family protein [Bacillota bacterium]
MAKRLDYLDKAKGILIILVVIGHIWQSGPVFNVIYAFHMPAFFLISGLLLQHTRSYEKPFGVFLRSKLFSFGIPFLFIELLGCLTDIIRHGVSLNWKGYLFNTLTLQYNDHNLWFLMDLFLIEILFYFLAKLFKQHGYLLLSVVFLYVVSRFFPTENAYISTLRSALYYSLFFAFGFCGSRFILKFHALACVFSAAVVLLVGLLLGKSDGHTLSLEGMVYIASGLCGAYAIIQAGKIHFSSWIDRVLTKSGMDTITIYGTHHIIYATIGVLLGITDFGSTPLVPGLIMLLGVAIMEVPIIYAIDRWAPWLAGKRKRSSGGQAS